jgi:hypothetical protein
MVLTDKFEMMTAELVMAYFKVLSQNVLWDTENVHKLPLAGILAINRTKDPLIMKRSSLNLSLVL